MYICYHHTGKAKDLYFRSFLLGEKKTDKHEERDEEREAVELEREDVSGKKKKSNDDDEDQGR